MSHEISVLSDVEKRLLIACARNKTRTYETYASVIKAPLEDVVPAADQLKELGLLMVRPARDSNNRYAGSGIILTEKGEALKSSII